MPELLKIKIENYIATVTIDNPPLNLMTPQYLREIINEFGRFGLDEQIKVVVFTGAGERAFCAGGDRRTFVATSPQEKDARQQIWWDAEAAIRNCGVPVIGAINGYAVGGGACFAAACDMLVASDKAIFDIPEVNIGVLAPFWSMRRLLPETKIRRMSLTTQKLTAQELFRFGCIEKVVPPVDLMSTAMELAAKIAEKDSYTLRVHKEILNRTEYMGIDQTHELVVDYGRKLPGIPDQNQH